MQKQKKEMAVLLTAAKNKINKLHILVRQVVSCQYKTVTIHVHKHPYRHACAIFWFRNTNLHMDTHGAGNTQILHAFTKIHEQTITTTLHSLTYIPS